MVVISRSKNCRSWIIWVRIVLFVILLGGAGYGVVELGHRYLGLHKLIIEQVTVSGCVGKRLVQVQAIADELCLGEPLFWFDSEKLRTSLESKRWIKGLIIRRDPPDRLNLVIEERQPVIWLVRQGGIFLVSDDGIVLDRLNKIGLSPVPVVVDPKSQDDGSIVQLIRVAASLRDKQKEFYDRLTELRWSDHGPVAFLEGLEAPIYLSRKDATKNIPNFQMLFLNELSKRSDITQLRYIDLRWEEEIAVGEPLDLQSIKK
jgi:cell division septal protein FtsQ